LESQELARRIARLIWEKKGADLTIMDLRKLTGVTEFFVLCTV